MIRWTQSWLSCADPPSKADLIFVLAGRVYRKVYGLRLYREDMAPRLVLSTGRYEIRRFAELALPQPVNLIEIAAPVAPPQRHFFVSLEDDQTAVERICLDRWGTLGEIEALRSWLERRPDVRRLLVVSSGSHLRRVRMCCRAFLPQQLEPVFVAAPPEISAANGGVLAPKEESFSKVFGELEKILLYRVILSLGGLGRHETR